MTVSAAIPRGWRLLDHTADLRIEGRGESREEALAALAEGLLHELGGGASDGGDPVKGGCAGGCASDGGDPVKGGCAGDGGEAKSGDTRRFAYFGVDLADTVVGALGELLWAVNGQRWLPSSCLVEKLTETEAVLTCGGAPIDPQGVGITEIKAATYHDFEFSEIQGGWAVRVVFDV